MRAIPDDDLDYGLSSSSISPPADPLELALESKDFARYLMAKAFFNCHEYQSCVAVFPPTMFPDYIAPTGKYLTKVTRGRGLASICQGISQKALFLALYALLKMGEREKVERLGPIRGPSDTGATVNKQLLPLQKTLETWFGQAREDRPRQGWLEYM